MRTGVVLAVAAVAGLLGAGAALVSNGPGPLLRSEPGQRVAQAALQADTQAPEGVETARRGEPVPRFRIPALEGGAFTLPDDFAGRAVLVNLWASWCAPCIEEMPELDRYARSQGTDGTRVLGIALDDADAVRAFLARIPVEYPQALDAPGPADAGVRLGNPRGVLPYSVLISADGRVLKTRIGPFETGEIDDWARH